jgi:hypothetical protein
LKRSIANKGKKNRWKGNTDLQTILGIKFSGDDVEPIIMADLPEQSFSGRNFIELNFNIKDPDGNLIEKIFKPDLYPKASEALRSEAPQQHVNLDHIRKAMEQGFADKTLFPHVGEYAGYIRSVLGSNNNTYGTVSNLPLSPKLVKLQPEDVFAALKAGKSLMIFRSTSGLLDYELINSSVGKGDTALVSIKRPEITAATSARGPIAFASPRDGDTVYGPRTSFDINIRGTYESTDFTGLTIEVQLGELPPKTATIEEIDIEHGLANWSVWHRIIPATESTSQETIFITARAKGAQPVEHRIQITAKYFTPPGQDEVNLPFPNDLRPRLFLIERYRLSSYLGAYGAGRTLKTFTLLPGEKTKISTRTYTKTVEQRKQASSILDSITDESTKDFENTLATEQSNKSAYEETFSYEVNGKAEANWGWGSAEVSGGVKGGTNSSREEFAKNVANTTQKHVAKASSKRDVQINTSYERTDETETEASTEREIQNINVSRTLNFVFRQMNQEFITILHLVDIKAAFWNGDSNPLSTTFKKIEVPLPELNSLLRQVLVNDDDPNALTIHKEVHKAIIDEITNIRDYNYDDLEADENSENFLEEVSDIDTSPGPDPITSRNYWRINKKYRSKYIDGPTNITNIPGVIMSVDMNVIRTEGIEVESILGKGLALDDYSRDLQDQSIRTKQLENDLKEIEIVKNRLAVSTVDKGPKEQVERYERVFPCCQPDIFSLWPHEDTDNKKEISSKKQKALEKSNNL